ncbi:RHS repeat-associated core domain-containing protein [Chitinimonas sp. PSY-7]|uniref:RHS repeat-associated core domain-containing protein n=1 Tax=Chitinimonas sp. PSY-7 TaxID=3459088 RepID=UPI00403FCE60
MQFRTYPLLLALAAAYIALTPATAATISSIQREFDVLGRLQKETLPDGSWASYGYDPMGNRTEMRDNLGRVTIYTYDEHNRLATVTDPLRGVTKYDFNPRGKLLSVTDPRGLITSYQYNGFDDLVQITSPDTGVTKFTYHVDGRVASSTDAKNQETRYDYDAAGRRSKVTFADGVVQTYAYGENGSSTDMITEIATPTGKISFSYDSLGRVSSEKRSVWNKDYTTSYGYDAAGRLNTLTYPSGRTVIYFYDNAGQVSKVTTKQGTATEKIVVQQLKYRPFGQVTGWTFGNGEVRTSSYDNLNQLTSLSLGDSTLTLGRDIAGRITSQKISGGWWERLLQRLSLPIGQTHSYGYDNLDRLTEWKDGRILQSRGSAFPASQGYGYDANGNRISFRSDDAVFKQDVDAKSNRLTASSGNGASPVYQYDANGSRTSGNGSYSYDARGRLVEASGAQFTLNALGERVAKTFQGTTMVFHYNQWGQLVAESDQQGVVKREYIYLGDTPVALVDNGMDIRNIHTDHLGTPRLVTDATKRTIWAWELGEPFGTSNANEDPEGTGAKYTFNLRFPGQYFDKETGNHYNYYRDYDPKSGRYLQSDPIGLDGGINTYAYVGGNPLSYVDPTGEVGVPGAIYGGIAGGIGGYISGGWRGALVGAGAGAAIGLVNPWASHWAGGAAGAAAASLAGQFAGNIIDGKDPGDRCNYDLTAIAGAAVGGAIGGPLNHAISRVGPIIRLSEIGRTVGSQSVSRMPANTLGAVAEGAVVGGGELFGTGRCSCNR